MNNENERVRREFLGSIDRERAADFGIHDPAGGVLAADRGRRNGSEQIPPARSGGCRYPSACRRRVPLSPGEPWSPAAADEQGHYRSAGTVRRSPDGHGARTDQTRIPRAIGHCELFSGRGQTRGRRSARHRGRGRRRSRCPRGYSITYQGQADQGGQSFGFIFRAMGAGLVLMYLLMVILFRSFTLPLSVHDVAAAGCCRVAGRDGAHLHALHAVLAARVHVADRARR